MAGLRLDAVAEGWRIGGGAVRALATDLGLGDRDRARPPTETWIDPGDGPAAPLPRRTVAGIPENPWDEGVRRIIGWRGTWRAYLDRVRPPLTIGQERSLGKLVRSRMGDAVLDRMVAPLSLGVYGIHPDDVDVEAAAPGLSTALTRTGSLSGGVAQLLGDAPGTQGSRASPAGTFRLVDALRARLADLGADLRTGTRVAALERGADGRWAIDIASGTDAASAAPHADAPADQATDDPAAASAPPVRSADAVVVAVPETEARRLLAGPVPALDGPVRPVGATEVVTLVVHEPALDAHPRGRAVYPVAGSRRAIAVTDSTARWPWLARSRRQDLHVVRVAFGSGRRSPRRPPSWTTRPRSRSRGTRHPPCSACRSQTCEGPPASGSPRRLPVRRWVTRPPRRPRAARSAPSRDSAPSARGCPGRGSLTSSPTPSKRPSGCVARCSGDRTDADRPRRRGVLSRADAGIGMRVYPGEQAAPPSTVRRPT